MSFPKKSAVPESLVTSLTRISHVFVCDDWLVRSIRLNLTVEHRLSDVVTLRRKLYVTIESFHVSRGERITHLVTIKTVSTLKCIFKNQNGCRCLSCLVRNYWIFRVCFLEIRIPFCRITEIIVPFGRLLSHWVGHITPFADFGNFSCTFAASQWV